MKYIGMILFCIVIELGLGSADPWNLNPWKSHEVARKKRSAVAQDVIVVTTGCTKRYQRRIIAAAQTCYDRALATVKYRQERATDR